MQVFVMINSARIMVNADENAKNWLSKKYMIKDLFGIQVIANVNVINHAMLENILDYVNCKCRKNLIDKLVE